MAQISGRTVLGVLRFAKDSGFPGGVSGLIATLPKEQRPVFEHRLRTGDWLPYEIYISLLTAIAAEQADGLNDLARSGLGRDARSILRILTVFSSVEGLVARGFGSWGGFLWSHHCDSGRVFLADQGEKTATMGLGEFPDIAPIHCTLVSHYLEAMGAAVGAKELKVGHRRCVRLGDPSCEFEAVWT